MDVLQPTSSTNTYTETTQLATQSLIPRMMNRMSTIETNHNALANLPHIVETYNNGTDWYRVYSDKWCKQGGVKALSSGVGTVTFFKAFKDTNYTVCDALSGNNGSVGASYWAMTKTTTTVKFTRQSDNNKNLSTSINWQAIGYCP